MKTAICAIIKDEHRFLEEWIDWHLALGFDAIHLFEDKGSKSHENICEKYSNVHLRRYENDEEVRSILSAQGSSHRQIVLYHWFATHYSGVYDWAAFIDLDEFIMFSDGYNLDRLCDEFNSYPAVLLNWKMMGASGHISRPSCGVIEAYICEGSVLKQDRLWLHKSLVNLNNYKGMATVHRAVGAVNTHEEDDFMLLHYDRAWLNHYFTKSWEDWCDRIFKKGGTLNGHRTCEQFFECNPSMEHLREELIGSVSDRIPNGTYWLDKQRGIIAGGNVRKITQLNMRNYDNRQV